MVARATYDLAAARRIYLQVFGMVRNDRSRAYKAGCMAGILRELDVAYRIVPYVCGTAQGDAWHYGFAEGRNRARWYKAWVGPFGA